MIQRQCWETYCGILQVSSLTHIYPICEGGSLPADFRSIFPSIYVLLSWLNFRFLLVLVTATMKLFQNIRRLIFVFAWLIQLYLLNSLVFKCMFQYFKRKQKINSNSEAFHYIFCSWLLTILVSYLCWFWCA